MKFRNMFLILQKEYFERVKKRTFIITTLLTPFLMILLMAAPAGIAYFTKDSSSKVLNLAVIDESHKIAQQLESGELVFFDPIASGDGEKVRANKSYDAYLYINEDIMTNTKNIKLESFEKLSMKSLKVIERNINSAVKNLKLANYDIEDLPAIIKDLNVNVDIKTLEISETGEVEESSSMLNYFTGFVGAFMIYMFILMYGSMVMNSVIDEKNSKVVEVMVSTVPPTQMMMGKIMGIGLVAVTQFVIWGITLFIGGTIVMSFFAESLASPEAMEMVGGMSAGMPVNDMMPAEIGMVLNNITDLSTVLGTMALFTLYFIGGYLFYASLFAAVASAVDNLQDVQQFQTPIVLPIIASIMFLSTVIEDPTSPLSFWLSIIPLTSPVIMMGRISGSIPIWELALSLFVLYSSFVGVIWVAGRIYRVGIFMHGKKPTYKELYKWIKYK